MALQVILAEDHNIVRNGIKALLESEKEIVIVGEATNGQEVLDALEGGKKVDLVLTDINMPVMDGISLLKRLRDQHPDICVVILSMFDNEQYISEAFKEGACAYLLKNISSDELIFCLKHVTAGGKYLCSELSMKFLDKTLFNPQGVKKNSEGPVDFSAREIEVLHLIAEGLTNAEMSDRLFISKRTIEGHRQSLIEKTGSKNTATLIKYAVQQGLVQ